MSALQGFREDIQGLRTVAVLPIVLFHAGINQLPGGFVGVDIFFVISGFLITSIISQEINTDSFSIVGFYKRRIARIFPALYMLIAATVLVGYTRLLYYDQAELAKSAAAAAFFSSNIFFFYNTDYFARSAEAVPLLHTWSLGVEEQFYIFYPLLLLLVRRYYKKALITLLWSTAFTSLACAFWLTWNFPEAGFYLLPARWWELALGGLVATGGLPKFQSKRLRLFASIIAALAITCSVLLLKSDWKFPAPWALLPVCATATLIAYGENTVIGKILAWRPVAAIGTISYSLYLWHWPIITFYRLETGMSLDLAESAILIVASLTAASLSYWLIERPCIRRLRTVAPQTVVSSGTVSAFAMALTGLAISVLTTQGVVQGSAKYLNYIGSAEQIYQFRPGECFFSSKTGQRADFRDCIRYRNDRPNVIVLGDSHAGHIWRALAERFLDQNVMQATASGCKPLIDTGGQRRCAEIVDYVLENLVHRQPPQTVVLAARWKITDWPKLEKTITHLRRHGIAVKVLGPVVEYDGDMPRLLAVAERDHDLSSVEALRTREPINADRLLATRVPFTGATYVSMAELECPDGRCRLFGNQGAPMHFDYGHYTLDGARTLVQSLPSL